MERALAVERLPERNAEAELIARRGDVLATELLRGHVRGRAEDRTGAGERVAELARVPLNPGLHHGEPGHRQVDVAVLGYTPLFVLARETEVEDPGTAVVADDHVIWLEVAVDEVASVCRGQPGACIPEDAQDRIDGARLGIQPLTQGSPLDELHRDEDLLAPRADLVDLHDVGMRELGERLGLATQPLPLQLTDLAMEQLDRDRALELVVEAGEHLAHAARAESRVDPEATDALWHSRAVDIFRCGTAKQGRLDVRSHARIELAVDLG